ncbi:hypothetical protein V2K35_13480 [Pseudomonas alliivorans]|nr:hypothetical protein [Pseudomonas alliivorans]MEE4814124.1 hypothetical protein [Pseudomonas alliivorans]MEE4874207.1 hypothetical protein [Pseudomonas alliivorans]
MTQKPFLAVQWRTLNSPALLNRQSSTPPEPFFAVKWQPALSLAYYSALASLTPPATVSPTG